MRSQGEGALSGESKQSSGPKGIKKLAAIEKEAASLLI